MSFSDLKKLALELYAPILKLEDVFPRESRRKWESIATMAFVGLFLLSLLAFLFGRMTTFEDVAAFSLFAMAGTKLYGLFLIAFAFRFVFTMIEAFHRSYYFRGLNLILKELYSSDNDVAVSFEVAATVYYSDENDLTAGFLTLPYGEDTMYRLGITPEEVTEFLSHPGRTRLTAALHSISDTSVGITLPVYAESIYTNDKNFQDWLFERKIQREDLLGAAEWIMRTNRLLRNNERWYSRDVLGRIEGLGKDIAFGEKFTLEQYGHPIAKDPVYRSAADRAYDEDGDVEAIEAELARGRQANVILVGKEGSGKRDVLAQLAHKIREGYILPPLQFKYVFLFDINALVGAQQEKSKLESVFTKSLKEAAAAGNVILVLENFPAAIYSASQLGVDLVSLLQEYFDASSLQIILTTDETGLHRTLERDGRLKQFFEIVRLHDVDDSALHRIIEQRSLRLEKKHHVIVTYPGVVAIATSARRYFPDGVMPDKAFDLLEETILSAKAREAAFVVPETVDHVVEQKTGIPLGEVTQDESEKLMHLEDAIKERVVGQEDAVVAIAGAMRRARAGINDPNRPIGTFLFLGPTGVGKTETCKALAEQFFGDERAMHRLDMSEYQTNDAPERLLGFSDGTPGRLVTMLKEEPYHLVLLDEFEKAAPGVHDLFLQILDEGEFTDAMGEKVNARNTIIIATSNAGADLLYKALEEKKQIAGMEDEIISTIVERGIFRPELINRFDATILFHPLVTDEATQIARLALEDLRERLRTRGYDIAITDELVSFVGTEAYDPRFGGRNINRFIKERVEQVIADKIIAGEAKKGEELQLSALDLKKE